MSIKIDVAYGELLDKISILEIKSERITDAGKRRNVDRELALLNDVWRAAHVDHAAVAAMQRELKSVNEALWDIEDAIRDCERRQEFGSEFVRLARSVYQTNDRRAELKRRMNDALGSDLTEEKSYQAY